MVWGRGPTSSFRVWVLGIPASSVGKVIFSNSLDYLNTFADRPLAINIWIYFCSVPLTCLSCASATASWFMWLCGKFWNLKVSPPALFSFKIVLAVLSPLHFQMNFKIGLLISAKKKKRGSWDFNRDFVACRDHCGKHRRLNTKPCDSCTGGSWFI